MAESSLDDRPHVVVLGGGFGGLAAVRALRHAPVRITLVDRSNHHVFQPLLYQVATSGMEPTQVGYPLRTAVRFHRNTEVLMTEARAIDPHRQTVTLSAGEALPFDQLIVATGAQPSYLGHDDWRHFAPTLKSLSDAVEVRRRVLEAFELAEQVRDPENREEFMRFIIVGGGPTGVELAGSLAELARHALTRDYRQIDTKKAEILLIQGGPTILPGYPAHLQKKAAQQLESLGVQVRTGARVEHVGDNGVTIAGEHVLARTVLWAAGVRPTDIVKTLGVPLTRRGQVPVTPELHPEGLPNIYVIGDLAAVEQDGKPVPGVAPAAMQEGRYAARAIVDRLAGRPVAPFRYRDKGQLAIIGRSRAVAQIPPRFQLSGFPAWLIYVVVHLWYLSGVRNRVIAFLNWGWSYLTFAHGARIFPRDWPEKTGAFARSPPSTPPRPPERTLEPEEPAPLVH